MQTDEEVWIIEIKIEQNEKLIEIDVFACHICLSYKLSQTLCFQHLQTVAGALVPRHVPLAVMPALGSSSLLVFGTGLLMVAAGSWETVILNCLPFPGVMQSWPPTTRGSFSVAQLVWPH